MKALGMPLLPPRDVSPVMFRFLLFHTGLCFFFFFYFHCLFSSFALAGESVVNTIFLFEKVVCEVPNKQKDQR